MNERSFINISGYRFVYLNNLESLQSQLKASLSDIGVKGAVVLAQEGINVTLAGSDTQINQAVAVLEQINLLSGIWFKRSVSNWNPHRRLKVRVRTEIISFDGAESRRLQALRPSAPALSPETIDQWLDTHRAMIMLDIRNDYEIVSGTFAGSVQLEIKHFKHFKKKAAQALADGVLDTDLPVVTFCTGGIRCEKAAPWLLEQGFQEVYQIEGGIINYLKKTEGRHWQGECFVFDERVELNPELQPTGAGLCDNCQLAVPSGSECRCQLGPHFHTSTSKNTV